MVQMQRRAAVSYLSCAGPSLERGEMRGKDRMGGRGAISFLSTGLFREAMQARKISTTFDVDRFFSDQIEAAVSQQLSEYPSCDVLQLRGGGDTPRDLLVGPDLASSSPFRTVQAQQHLIMYLAQGVLGETRSARCPYFHACKLEQRLSEPARCEERPWEWWAQSSTCWYGIAASAGVAREKVQAAAEVSE
ncbi:MAG: hypothetical protein ACI8PZ_006611 [Myxococcota bacterium]|jgi:hypothetical protein